MTRRFNTMPWGIGDLVRYKGQSPTYKLRTIDYQGRYTATPESGGAIAIYPCDYHKYEAVQPNRS